MPSHLGLPHFSTLNTEGFKEHLDAILQNNLKQVENMLSENHVYTWENLMYPLESLDDVIEQYWSPLSHLHSVVDSKELRACYDACLPCLSAYDAAIGHNKKLFKAIQSIDTKALDGAQQKIIADALLDFKLSGVALSKENKKRFEAIQARLAELSNQFQNNVLDASHAFTLDITDNRRIEGIPEHALHTAKALAKEKGLDGYVFNLEFPSYQAVITHAKDRALREEIYQAYVTRASDTGPTANAYDNSRLMNEILALRHEKAQLLGFNNYAEVSIATKMADCADAVLTFMQDLVKKAHHQAKEEFKQLQQFAKEAYGLDKVEPWDVAFLSEQRRIQLFSVSQEELRPYFPQPKVMQGIFAILNKLYGMQVEEIKGVDVWHKDVQCFCIIDDKNQVRGYVYTDLYARSHKRGGAWMDSLRTRRKLEDGAVQLPIATLTCNFAKPTGDKPALLSHDEVVTLFHEFGHCLHHVLTQVDYMSASGINGVEWDAVELPSQFFENWCWDKEALTMMTEHVDTGESLPKALYDKLNAAKNFQSAMAMVRQLEFALFDFRIHQEYSGQNESFISDTLSDVRAKTQVIPVVSYNRFQHSFSHIFGGGYAAGYYSYSWAEVLSSDAFSKFEEEGVFNPKTGQAFLKNILEVGGSQKASQAFKNFRGRQATIDALLRHNGIFADPNN